MRNIKCAPVYYDQTGKFHIERRLGCLACPLKSDIGLSDYEKYPKLLKVHIKAYQKYLDTHSEHKFPQKLNGSAYNGFFYRLFCRSEQDYIIRTSGGIFPEQAIDTKKYLEQHFGIKL